MTTQPRAMTYLDGGLRGLMVILFTIAGVMKLTAHPFELHGFAHFGYDSWFMYAIGALEFAAAFGLLHARLILPSAAAMAAVLVGAIVSHVRVGDPLAQTTPAIIALSIVLGLLVIHLRKVEPHGSHLRGSRRPAPGHSA